MRSFRDRTVLLTGAASGIGRLMAVAFAERGARVVVTDRDGAGAEAVARELRRHNGRAFAYPLDVTKPEAVRELRTTIERDAGCIDALVNNAGVVFGGPFERVPLEKHLTTYRVNVEGVVTLTHTFLPHLLCSRDGHLVNIASASGFIGLPNAATYASSKWAVLGFSESLRIELAERKARLPITVACPGYIATGMFAGVRPPLLTPLLTPDRIVSKIMRGIARNDEFVLEPFAVKTLETCKALLPRRVFERGARLLGVSSSMDSWKGRAEAV
jgi:all-trans-retinol dehydrogenase (NAD+)